MQLNAAQCSEMQCKFSATVPFAKIYTCPALFAPNRQGCKNIYIIQMNPGMSDFDLIE